MSLKVVLWVLFVAMLPCLGFAQNPKQPEIKYLLTSPSLLLEDIIPSDQFKKSDHQYLNFGYFEHCAWLKFDFETRSNEELVIQFHQYFIDSLKLFVTQENEELYESEWSGVDFLKQGQERYLTNNTYAFSVNLGHGTYTAFMKLQSQYSPIRAKIHLWDKEGFQSRKRPLTDQTSFWLIVYGVIGFAGFAGCLMFVFTREWKYLFYIFFVFVNVINLNVAKGFITPFMPWFESYEYDIRGMFNAFLVIATCCFVLSIVPKEYANRFTRWFLQFLIAASILLIVVTLALPYSSTAYAFLIYSFKPVLFLTLPLPVAHFFLALKNGHRMSAIYIASYAVFLISGIIHILNSLRIIEYFVANYWEIGVLTELGIFSLAFAYQYNQSMKEKLALANQVNEDRKQYLERYYLSQENERKRIAKNLHDGVIQQLVSLKFGINSLETNDKDELLETLGNATHEIRDLSHQLMPKSLVKLGLGKAVEDLLESALKHTSIQYNYEFSGLDQRLSEIIELNLYRIIQELINNVVKHSAANNLDVQLYRLKDNLHLIFEDDGIGFSPEKAKDGIGLQSIESRIESVKGNFQIEPGSNSGTIITIKIPLT